MVLLSQYMFIQVASAMLLRLGKNLQSVNWSMFWSYLTPLMIYDSYLTPLMICNLWTDLFVNIVKYKSNVKIKIWLHYEVGEWKIISHPIKKSNFHWYRPIYNISMETVCLVIQDIYVLSVNLFILLGRKRRLGQEKMVMF